MIYEVVTTQTKPGAVAEFENRFAEVYEHRKKYSELAVFWHTEIGPLNQTIAVWPYASHEERARIRASVLKDPKCAPKTNDLVAREFADIVTPTPFSPELKPGTMGPIFEMRTYTVPAGEIPLLIENWTIALPRRVPFSPVFAVWYTELGGLNKWTHIWPYKSLADRGDVRAKVAAAQAWPPSAIAAKEGRKPESFVEQENKIVMPAKFSPIQ
jgi:hypothetical protein